MKITNDCVYRKVGRRYEPIGVCEPVDHLPDGIWYVRHKKHSRGCTNTEYIGEMLKIGEAEDISINTQCGIVNIADYILDCPEMRELLHTNRGYSISEIVNLTVKKVYDLTNKNE